MTDKNTKSKVLYIAESFWWAVCAYIWYDALCFFCLPGKNIIDSRSFLIGFSFFCTLAGVILTFRRRRNAVSLAVNVLFPYGVYAAVSMYELYSIRVIVAAVLAAVLCSFFIFMVVTRPKKKGKPVAFRRFRHCALGARTIIALCALIIIVPSAVNTILGKGIYTEEGNRAPYVEAPGEWTIDNKMDTVKLFDKEHWGNLSIDEKLEAAAVVKNIEMSNMGISHEIYIMSQSMDNDVLGWYSHEEKAIALNIDHMRNSEPEDIIRTICHECFHAYEHQQVELYDSVDEKYKNMPMFSPAQKYAYEFENYVNGDDDYEAYYSQSAEENAREYAEYRTQHYYEKINDFYFEAKN